MFVENSGRSEELCLVVPAFDWVFFWRSGSFGLLIFSLDLFISTLSVAIWYPMVCSLQVFPGSSTSCATAQFTAQRWWTNFSHWPPGCWHFFSWSLDPGFAPSHPSHNQSQTWTVPTLTEVLSSVDAPVTDSSLSDWSDDWFSKVAFSCKRVSTDDFGTVFSSSSEPDECDEWESSEEEDEVEET